jgi:hypothetical protein
MDRAIGSRPVPAGAVVRCTHLEPGEDWRWCFFDEVYV